MQKQLPVIAKQAKTPEVITTDVEDIETENMADIRDYVACREQAEPYVVRQNSLGPKWTMRVLQILTRRNVWICMDKSLWSSTRLLVGKGGTDP